MNFDTLEQFFMYVNYMEDNGYFKEIGFGSQGICYLNKIDKKVYKIFHQVFDEYDEDWYVCYDKKEILRFSNVINKTFIWPNDVISIKNEIVGYISDYIDAKSLYKINPLNINLDDFSKLLSVVKKDINIISNYNILSFDVMYNILYNKEGIYVVDHDEFIYTDLDCNKLNKINNDNINYEIMLFLIDGFFDDFICGYNELREMYCNKGVDIENFINAFRKCISEYLGYEIVKLQEASLCFNKSKKRKVKYQRNIFDV